MTSKNAAAIAMGPVMGTLAKRNSVSSIALMAQAQ